MKENVVSFPDRIAIEEEAGEWLIKLDGDTPLSADERLALSEWLNRSPRHKAELHDLAKFWGKMNVLTELAVPLVKPDSQLVPSARYHRLAFASAALVLIAISLFSLWYIPEPLNESNALYATVVGQQQTLSLSDGSVIQLNTNSQVEVDYDEEFRNIYLLQGEVHFEVAKNPERPFRVYAGDGIIQAIGTAFSVCLESQDVNITVTEGRVSLASIAGRKNVMQKDEKPLLAESSHNDVKINQLGILDAGQGTKMTRRISEKSVADTSLDTIQTIEQPELERRLSWREGMLIYSGEPLEEVVADISRYTTVSIEIMDAEVESIKIGGRFKVGETDVLFDVLEENFGLRVEYRDHDQVQLFAALK